MGGRTICQWWDSVFTLFTQTFFPCRRNVPRFGQVSKYASQRPLKPLEKPAETLKARALQFFFFLQSYYPSSSFHPIQMTILPLLLAAALTTQGAHAASVWIVNLT